MLFKVIPNLLLAMPVKGALVKLERYGKAVAVFDQGIQFFANKAVFHANRGFALLKLERYQEAVDAFNRALAIESDYADWRAYRDEAADKLDRQVNSAPATFVSLP